ncbi:MAG: AMP-binding protein, partial [Herbaspirillum sp.]
MAWDAPIDLVAQCQLLDQAAYTYPSHIALEFNNREFTYTELQSCVNRAAVGLQRLGVKPRVQVGLYLPNTPHYVIAFFAILRAGGTVVNYSPLDAERVLEHKIADSETDFIITLDDPTLYSVMDRLLGATRLKALIVG